MGVTGLCAPPRPLLGTARQVNEKRREGRSRAASEVSGGTGLASGTTK